MIDISGLLGRFRWKVSWDTAGWRATPRETPRDPAIPIWGPAAFYDIPRHPWGSPAASCDIPRHPCRSRGMPRYPMGSHTGSRGISRDPIGIPTQIAMVTLHGNRLCPVRYRSVRDTVEVRVGVLARTRGIMREVTGIRGNS